MKNFFKKLGILMIGATMMIATTALADRTFSLPDQTGHSGQQLTTNGTNPSWATTLGGPLAIGDGIGGSAPDEFLITNALGDLANIPLSHNGTILGNGITVPLSVNPANPLAIGNVITGAGGKRVLFEDATGHLQDSTNFQWGGKGLKLTNPGLSGGLPMFQTISSLGEDIFQTFDRGRTLLNNYSNGGPALTIDSQTSGTPELVVNNLGNTLMSIDGTAGHYYFGPQGGTGNGTHVYVNDASKQYSVNVAYQSALNPWYYLDGNAGQAFEGDFAGNGNHLWRKMTDPTDKYEINGQKAVVETGPTYTPIGAPGLDDFHFISFNGNGSRTYTITSDGVNTFQWSDGFTTVPNVVITGGNQTIGTLNDAVVKFDSILGHTIGDIWTTSFAVTFGRMQVLDGLNRTACTGDCDSTGNSTSVITDDTDAQQSVAITGNKLVTLKSNVTNRTGGVQDSSIKVVKYGSNNNITANDGSYDFEVSGGTGTTNFNLPDDADTTLGTTYIFSDLDAISSGAGNHILINAPAGSTINGATIGATYTMLSDGASITIKKVVGKTWKVE